MFWKDENTFKGKQTVTANLFTGKEKQPQSDCRFIPSRRGTNNSYSQYLLKENINCSNIGDASCQNGRQFIGQMEQQQQNQVNGNQNSSQQLSQSAVNDSGNGSISSTSSSNGMMMSQNSQNSQNTTNGQTYQKLMEECLFQEKKHQRKRVLNFKNELDAPISLDKCLSKTFEQASQDCGKVSRQYRYISSQPERILDAPSLNDDYYLNLMDWGDCGATHKGTLAICLGGEVYLWNENDIVNLLKIPSPSEYVSSVSWMNMKRKNCLAVGFSDNTIQLWDTEKCLPYRVLKGHTGRVSSLSWNNYILSSGSRDTQIINHDIRQKQNIVSRYQGHEQEVCGLKWSPDGTQLASGSNDNTLRIWDINSSTQRASFSHHKAAVKALAWCPWQKNLLASGGGTQDKTIKFWNTEKMDLINSLNCGSQVCSLLWNPNDKELISSHGFQDNQLILWSYPSMQKITELHGHTNRVLHMALSPDGATVCSASSDETLRFWKVFQGSQYDNQDYDDSNPFTKLKRDGPFSQNLFIR